MAPFLQELQKASVFNGPRPGSHNFFRGGLLATYDLEMHSALNSLADFIDIAAALTIWQQALSTQ